MAGIRHIVVGFSGCGKTTFTKGLIKDKPKDQPILIYDINREYLEDYPYPFISDTQSVIEKAAKLKKTYIVFEEATIFFDSANKIKEMKDLLVRARHTENYIQLNFHSFSSIPKYIKNLIDYITIFNTGDSDNDVLYKFGEGKIFKTYQEVRSHQKDKKYLKGANNVSIYHKTIFVYGGA